MWRVAKGSWRIAHLSDMHVGKSLSLQDFEKIVSACRLQGAEHLIVTGDLTDGEMIHQESDARAIRDILLDHGYDDPRSTTVIPGNHDLHGPMGLPGDRRATERNLPVFFRLFGRFLRKRSLTPRFPIVKRIGRLTIFCLNSICPSSGEWDLRYLFPARQLRSLARAFRHCRRRDPRILVLHHYPYRIRLENIFQFSVSEWLEDMFWLPLRGWRKLVGLCARNRVRYILHGHSHSNRMVGFQGTGLVALGQGRTGEGREFSLYDVPVEGTGRRSIVRLVRGVFEVGRPEPIVPELVVHDWSQAGEC